MKKAIASFNKIDSRILAFLIPCLFFLSFKLTYNEEQYFAYAKAYMDSSWMKDSFVFSDFAGTRILFQWIFGFILRFLSFEQLAFWGKLTGFILLAFPVASIARFFKLNNLLLSFWILVLFIPQQNFFGGEWIYGGFEAKTIAYVFVLWSLYYMLREKFLPAIIFAVISVYWHLLVGGWFSIYLFIFLIPAMLRNRKILLYWVVFGIMQLPLLYYLYKGLLSDSQAVINGVNISWVYTSIRNPNHIGLFASMEYFLHYHAGKVVWAAIALIISAFIYRKILPAFLRPANNLLIIIISLNLLFVIVAYFDHNGAITKTYPFRGSSLSMFLFQLETIVIFRHNLIPWLLKLNLWKSKYIYPGKKYMVQVYIIGLSILLAIVFKINDRIHAYSGEKETWNYIDQLAEAIRDNSPTGEKFLLLCPEHPNILCLPRKAERDSYFYFRFIPTRNQDIYNWYQRKLIHDKILEDARVLKNPANNVNAGLLVSCSELNNDFLKLIRKIGPYYLYRIL